MRIGHMAILGALVLVAGCASSPPAAREASLGDINNPEALIQNRIAGVRLAEAMLERGEGDPEALRESLKWAVWKRNTTPIGLRIAAAEALLSDEARIEDTRNMFRLLIPTEQNDRMLRFVGDEAVDRGWTDLAPSFVRSWARAGAEAQVDPMRPERRILDALFPGRSAEEVIFLAFAGDLEGVELEEDHRAAAWSLLRRLDADGSVTRELLVEAEVDSADPLLDVMRRAARDLRVVVDTEAGVRWLKRLAEPRNSQAWSEASAAIGALDGERVEGLALRHVPVILWASRRRPELLGMTRDSLLSLVEQRLEGRRTHGREESDRALGGSRESLRDWRGEMVWADLLAVLCAAEAVHDPELAFETFKIADTDKGDTSTEYGGVIDTGASGAFRVTAYPPRPTQRFGDDRFVASIDMLDASDLALFHFHMQVQQFNNARFAGPSGGDITYARENERHCIVYTFVDRATLNADYYQPDGVRIDLGEIKRPGAR